VNISIYTNFAKPNVKDEKNIPKDSEVSHPCGKLWVQYECRLNPEISAQKKREESSSKFNIMVQGYCAFINK
jgi:hypothetical protein